MSESKPSVESLFAAAEERISCYNLTNESTISDDRIHEIVNLTVKHAPSTFNVQSARAVILLKEEHSKLWNLIENVVKTTAEEKYHKMLLGMISGFKNAYGTVLFFEDNKPLDELAGKFPLFGHLVPDEAEASSGMHQFLVWTAFTLEGLGGNLQHFNFLPAVSEGIRKQWELPGTWKLISQLVFGKPKDGKLERRSERTYAPLEDRVKVFGS